jgi:hypothetical protein
MASNDDDSSYAPMAGNSPESFRKIRQRMPSQQPSLQSGGMIGATQPLKLSSPSSDETTMDSEKTPTLPMDSSTDDNDTDSSQTLSDYVKGVKAKIVNGMSRSFAPASERADQNINDKLQQETQDNQDFTPVAPENLLNSDSVGPILKKKMNQGQ